MFRPRVKLRIGKGLTRMRNLECNVIRVSRGGAAEDLRKPSHASLMRDMDEWGYTFRLGSAAAWFSRDAADARRWLVDSHLIDERGEPTWRLRGATVPEPGMVETR